MEKVYLICAAVGGTVFLCQFVLSLIGFGADDVDVVDDVPDDASFDVGHADTVGGDGVGDLADTLGDGAESHGHVLGHGSTWLFGVISFRTVVAALTFFGLVGYAALQAGQSMGVSLIAAIAAGLAAMYGVHWLVLMLYRLGQDRSLRVGRAIGARGTVYVPIPPEQSGTGKVQINLQDRIAEYAAITSEAATLPTGHQIVVTRIVSPETVEVASIDGHRDASASSES